MDPGRRTIGDALRSTSVEAVIDTREGMFSKSARTICAAFGGRPCNTASRRACERPAMAQRNFAGAFLARYSATSCKGKSKWRNHGVLGVVWQPNSAKVTVTNHKSRNLPDEGDEADKSQKHERTIKTF